MREIIVVRGGGDLATGTIHRLWRAGFRVLVLETQRPSAIRRQVALCEAVYEGTVTVEGMTGVLVPDGNHLEEIWQKHQVPVLVDPQCECLAHVRPAAVVDAIIAKRNLGITRDMAPLTIALGPGFTAGEDVDVVIETARGHKLGRVITQGTAKPDTGIPGIIGGYGAERVIRAPAKGTFRGVRTIGDVVNQGDVIACIEEGETRTEVLATIPGILRGLLRDGYPVSAGFKVADIDPRIEELENCTLISDKARCIAGAVLEQICANGNM